MVALAVLRWWRDRHARRGRRERRRRLGLRARHGRRVVPPALRRHHLVRLERLRRTAHERSRGVVECDRRLRVRPRGRRRARTGGSSRRAVPGRAIAGWAVRCPVGQPSPKTRAACTCSWWAPTTRYGCSDSSMTSPGGFVGLGGGVSFGLTAGVDSTGVTVYVRGNDGGPYRRRSIGGGTFAPWQPLGGYLTSVPAVTGNGPTSRLFARGGDNALYVQTITNGVATGVAEPRRRDHVEPGRDLGHERDVRPRTRCGRPALHAAVRELVVGVAAAAVRRARVRPQRDGRAGDQRGAGRARGRSGLRRVRDAVDQRDGDVAPQLALHEHRDLHRWGQPRLPEPRRSTRARG